MRHARTGWGCAVLLMVASAAVACGSEPAPAPLPEPSSGQELPEPQAERAEPEAPDQPMPIEAGPAVVTIDATVKGQSVAAEVRLLGADGSEVAAGNAGEPISLQSGEYTMQVAIRDEKVLVDKPTQRRPLTLQPGDSLREPVDFPWASIQLNVRVNGKPDNSAVIELKRQGAVVGTFKSGADFVPISPGRYDAEVRTKGATVPVQGLMFPQGATQSVPVNVQL